MVRKWIVVGISGCTNSGKTSLSTFLINAFPGSVVLNQDKYFRPDNSKEHVIVPELNHKNWERLEAVYWDTMVENFTQVLDSVPVSDPSLLIIEGHIIYNHPTVRKLFQKKYFLTLNKEECYRRRVNRVYDPPDIPGYFEKVVFPMYLSNLEDVKSNCKDIVFLDGTDDEQSITKNVMMDLKKYILES